MTMIRLVSHSKTPMFLSMISVKPVMNAAQKKHLRRDRADYFDAIAWPRAVLVGQCLMQAAHAEFFSCSVMAQPPIERVTLWYPVAMDENPWHRTLCMETTHRERRRVYRTTLQFLRAIVAH